MYKIKNLLYMLPFAFLRIIYADGLIEIRDGRPHAVKPSGGKVETWSDTLTDASNQAFDFYKLVLAVSILLTVICLVIGAVQLGAAAGNPAKKQKAWGRIKTSIIVIACLGGIITIVGVVFSLLK